MPDLVRESVFNLLRGHVQGETVVDVFAGSGAVGFEAISRGAERCVFIERDQRMARLIEDTASSLGVSDRCEVVAGDALGAAGLVRVPARAHLIFFDPPYELVTDREAWKRVRARFGGLIERLDETGYAVLRTPWPARHRTPVDGSVAMDLSIENADGPETHAYGSTGVHLYMRRDGGGETGRGDAGLEQEG